MPNSTKRFAPLLPIASLTLVLGSVMAADDEFVQVKTRSTVASLALSEDGKLLAVSETNSDCVSLWDVVADKQVATIDTPKPGALLWRGDRLFVAGADPQITAFNAAKQWRQDAVYKLPSQSAQQLSAAQGKFFDGRIVGLSGNQSWVLDTESRQTTNLYTRDRIGAVAVSYDGKQVIEQYNVGGTPSGYPVFFDYGPYISGEAKETPNDQYRSLGVLRQVRPGPIWIDEFELVTCQPTTTQRGPTKTPARGSLELNSLTGDLPSTQHHEWRYVVPDALADIFYVIGDDTISWRSADAALTKLGSRTFHLPEALARLHKMGEFITVRDQSPARLPVAVSAGDQLYLYTMTDSGALYRYHASIKQQVENPTAVGLPPKVIEGEPITRHLFSEDPAGAKFTVLKGSPLIHISPQGVLQWTPQKEEIGTMEVKVRCERGPDEVSFLRYTVQIIPADLASRAAADKQEHHALGRHYLLNESYFLTPGLDCQSILLLDGQSLRVLDADGLAVNARIQLPEIYRRILPRKECFIAVNEKTLDVIDRKGLTIRHHVPIDCSNILDVALHPTRPITYLTVVSNEKNPQGRQLPRVIAVDEDAGTCTTIGGVFAQRIAIDASGRFAFVALQHPIDVSHRKDWIFPDRAPFHAERGTPPACALIVYDISAADWKFADVNLDAEDRNAQADDPFMRLILSSDNALIGFVSAAGIEGRLPAFSTSNIHQAVASYAGRLPGGFEFHPALDMVATKDRAGISILSKETGAPEAQRLDLNDEGLRNPGRFVFTPGGRHLLVECFDADNRRMIRAVALRLEPEEKKTLLAFGAGSTREIAPRIAPQSVSVDAAAFDALRGNPGPSMSPKEIASRSHDAIVIVESRDGFGTGFFVGSKGYVLTCAHVLPKVGNPSIIRGLDKAHNADHRIPAIVVRTDRELDLALLKVELKSPAVFVHLAGGDVDTGENVTVIGNPGLGGLVLDYSVTTGIVSNAKRTLFQRSFLQTNAAVNPGNSGGPVFNSHGDVIGIAVLKANIENTAFAIPADVAIEFLRQATLK